MFKWRFPKFDDYFGFVLIKWNTSLIWFTCYPFVLYGELFNLLFSHMQVNLRVVILRSSLFHIKHSGVGQKTLFLKWRKHLISCCTNHKANRNYWNTTPSTHIPTTGNPGKQCCVYVGCLSFFILMVCLSGMVTSVIEIRGLSYSS